MNNAYKDERRMPDPVTFLLNGALWRYRWRHKPEIDFSLL